MNRGGSEYTFIKVKHRKAKHNRLINQQKDKDGDQNDGICQNKQSTWRTKNKCDCNMH